LRAAIDAQIAAVKAAPGDQAKRVFLFELLCFAGEWDRARRQIEAMAFDDIELETSALQYKTLLESEAQRHKVFAEGVRPKFLGDAADAPPPEHVRLRLEALGHLRQNRGEQAATLIQEADECSPLVAGTLNGSKFDLLCDADPILGSVLEVMAKGQYFWVPLEEIAVLAVNPPRFPRDLIWAPATIETQAGEQGQVFLPTIYFGSWQNEDDQVKLGRMTDWKELEGNLVQGVGLKMFLAGEEPVSILDWRELRVDPAEAEAGAEPGAAASEE
jgi:type VI secretion system protein ImpE